MTRHKRLSWQHAREIRQLIRAARDFRTDEGFPLFGCETSRRDIKNWSRMIPRWPRLLLVKIEVK